MYDSTTYIRTVVHVLYDRRQYYTAVVCKRRSIYYIHTSSSTCSVPFTATPRTRKEFLSRQSLLWLRGRTIGALRAERHTLTSAEWTSCSACHELLCSRAFLFFLCSAECATPTNASLFANFPRNLANAPLPPESFRTCFVCATHAHSHFCPQHWLLCHLRLY